MKKIELTEVQKKAGFSTINGMMVKWEIQTGEKNLRYTLWRYLYGTPKGVSECYYGILGKDIEAVKKSLIKRGLDQHFDMENLEDEICIKVDKEFQRKEIVVSYIMDGFKMKLKKSKARKFYYVNSDYLTKDFWNVWKERKEELKKDGFFVSKFKGEFYFMKMGNEI